MLGATAAYAVEGDSQPAAASAATAQKLSHRPTEAQIRALFDQWAATLATDDPEKVADRYARDGVLVPTMSNVVRADRAGIVDYFEHFLQKQPEAEITRSIVNVLDKNTAVDTGTYRFTLTDPETGVTKDVDARYTFVYEKIGGKWLIINHHSSAMPEG